MYILKYLGFAAVFDAPVGIEQRCLSRLEHRFDFQSMLKIIKFVGSVQLVVWTLTHGAVVSRTHGLGGIRIFQPILTQ